MKTLLLAFAMMLPAFQEKPAAVEQPKKGSIEGTVVDGTSGQLVKDVTLLLMNAGAIAAPISGKSDEAGHFQFRDLGGGTYMLVADHPKYARQAYGSRNGLMGGTPLVLPASGELKDLAFKLQANGVVSGRALDEDGEPMSKVMVAALKGVYQRGKKQYMPLGTARTDDLGAFRIANLAAGLYLLCAGVMPTGSETDETYLPTYYPNSAEAVGGAMVEVAAGRDVAGMDIRMLKSKAVRVKGKVVGSGEQKGNVRLTPKDGGILAMLFGRTSTVKADGTFEIAGVAPGSYTIRVSADPMGLKPMGGSVAVEVGDQPVDGVIVPTTASSAVSGAVTVEEDAKVALGEARVVLEPAGGLTMVPPMTKVNDDGTFTLQDVTTERYLVRLVGGPENVFVRSVRIGTREMSDDGLDIGASAEKIEIRLCPAAARVDGIINGQDDKPMSGVTVALIPSSGRYLLYQSALTDQKGSFSFKNVTPGDYKVLAWEEVEPNAFQNPEFVKPFEGKAESISLRERDQKVLTLKAIPRS